MHKNYLHICTYKFRARAYLSRPVSLSVYAPVSHPTNQPTNQPAYRSASVTRLLASLQKVFALGAANAQLSYSLTAFFFFFTTFIH